MLNKVMMVCFLLLQETAPFPAKQVKPEIE
jgi:hypothetical protein